VLSALLTAYSVLTMGEAKLGTASTDSIHGQLAAEAGVNLRCAAIRDDFQQWERVVSGITIDTHSWEFYPVCQPADSRSLSC
jgi:hypothetical protein